MTNEVTLKPCPFCGGDAELTEGHRDHWKVRCFVCRAERGQTFAREGAKEAAIAAWNTRASQAVDTALPADHCWAGDAGAMMEAVKATHLPITPPFDSEAVERVAKAIQSVACPFDHHTHTPESCAFGDALDAAEAAARGALLSLAEPVGGEKERAIATFRAMFPDNPTVQKLADAALTAMREE